MINLISPVVFLGGLGIALVLNAYAVVRLDVGREDGSPMFTLPVGCRTVVDSSRERFEIVEPAVL